MKMRKSDMKKKSAQASRLLKLIANENRLLVLCQLVEGEKCVSDLLEVVDVSQSALSQNLIKMRDDGILSSRREGTKIYYAVSDKIVHDLLEVLYKHFCT